MLSPEPSPNSYTPEIGRQPLTRLPPYGSGPELSSRNEMPSLRFQHSAL